MAQNEQNEQNTPFLIGPEDSDIACLLIHGFSGTPVEMRGMGDALAAHGNGIRVYGMQVAGHTGHTGSDGEPDALISAGRREWIASAEAALVELEKYRYLFVAGLSMGGVLALHLANAHPQRIAGVIALSTPTRFNWGLQSKLLPVARHLIKWFYPLQRLNFNNPKVQEMVLQQARLRDPDVTIDFTDAQTIAYIKQLVRLPVPALDELQRLINSERKRLVNMRVPLLIIQSKRDQTVLPACADELFRLTSSASPKSLHWLEQSDHVITTGPEREEVYNLSLEFIDTIIRGVAVPAQPADALQDEVVETHHDR